MKLQLIISIRSSSSHTCSDSGDYVFSLWSLQLYGCDIYTVSWTEFFYNYHNNLMRSLTMSTKFASKQEKTQYYITDKPNLFSTYDVQYSDEANSGWSYAPSTITTWLVNMVQRCCSLNSTTKNRTGMYSPVWTKPQMCSNPRKYIPFFWLGGGLAWVMGRATAAVAGCWDVEGTWLGGFLAETPSVTDLRVMPWYVPIVSILKPSVSMNTVH